MAERTEISNGGNKSKILQRVIEMQHNQRGTRRYHSSCSPNITSWKLYCMEAYFQSATIVCRAGRVTMAFWYLEH